MLPYRIEATGCLYPYTLLLTFLEGLDPDRRAPILERGGKCRLHEDASGQTIKVRFASGEGSKTKYDFASSSNSSHIHAGDDPAVDTPLIDAITLCWGTAKPQTVLYARCPAAVEYIETLTEILRAERLAGIPNIGATLRPIPAPGSPSEAAAPHAPSYMEIMMAPAAARIMFLLVHLWDPLRPGSCYGPSPTRVRTITITPLLTALATITSPVYSEAPTIRIAATLIGSEDGRAATLRDAGKCGFIVRIPEGSEPITMSVQNYRPFEIIAKHHRCEVRLIPRTWNGAAVPQKWRPVQVQSVPRG
jgi:hypothetical protein